MNKWFQKHCIGCRKWLLPSLIVIGVLFININIVIPWFYTSYTNSPYAPFINNLWIPLYRIVGKNTVTDAVDKISPKVRGNLKNYYEKAGVKYPGDKAAFLFFEEEESAEIWIKNRDKWHLIHTYSAKKGKISPGVGPYKIIGLNSNLWYSLSMRLKSEYFDDKCFDIFLDRKLTPPDRAIAIGHDEFSTRCFQLGEDELKELYVLAHDININNVEIIMSPNDMRKKDPKININAHWSRLIKERLQKFVVK